MRSNKDLLQEPNARAPRFEAIWEKTEGTDLEKTLAMLQAYRDRTNWGTYSSEVRSVVKQYVGGLLGGGYCKTVKKKDALVFRIEFLFLLLSEEISFNHINPEGDLAAIFHVIFMHTNLNAYDFAQGTRLYSTYEIHKDKTKEHAANKRGQMDIFAWFKEDVDPGITDFLIKKLRWQQDMRFGHDHGLPVIFCENTFYDLFAHSLSKKDEIANWDNIEKVLMNQPKFNFTHLLHRVVECRSTSGIDYLLKEMKPDVRVLYECLDYRSSSYPDYRTLLQTIAVYAACGVRQSDYECSLAGICYYLGVMKILIQYDPGCIGVEDSAGNNFLFYWSRVIYTINYLSHTSTPCIIFNESIYKEDFQRLTGEISSMIDNNFHYPKRAFTFFQGRSNNGEENNIKMLPNDVLGLICAHTMYSEITAPKK
jgi:hypothetical protein